MALRTTVAVGNITSLSDARYCAGMGVDYLCFPSSRIDPITYQEITGWVSGPRFIVDVSREHDPVQTLSNYPNAQALIHFTQLATLEKSPDSKRWVDVRGIDKNLFSRWENALSRADFIVTNESQLGDFPRETVPKLIISPMNEAFVKTFQGKSIGGIWLEGSAEERPGLKDYSQLEVILELLEVD